MSRPITGVPVLQMVSKMNVKKLLVLLTLAFCFLSVVPLAFAQNEAGGPGASSDKNDSNPGTASDIREDFYKRMKNAKSFAPQKYGGEDVVVEEESKGPGEVHHALKGPVQVWPVPVADAVSKVPTMRDQGIMRNPLKTFGYPVSDTQYQVIHRYNQNIMLEQLFDPEKVIWVINAMGMIQTQSAANSAANLARNQSSSAIEYAEKYLPNFTTQGGNRWNMIRDKLFVPMAILLLLPGAVLAQVKAIIAQGSPLFGDVNPFDGIIRSIVAIFFIPATYLVVNYGIDVSNSIALTIRDNYQRIFHSNMYKDAECAEKRAFPIRPKDSNDNGIFRKSKPTGKGAGDLQAWTDHERNSFDIYGSDPCKGGNQANDLADETTPVLMNVSRVAVNVANVGLAGTWNVMCAFQLAYLHYLFLMGPIVAALWVWPIDTFRKALGSWIEGVLIICFWALFWNTTILLMACFRNVCVTGTVIMTALNVLSIYSVQHAFNFLGLVQAASREASAAVQEAGSQAAGGAMAHGAKSGVGAQGAAISGASASGHAVSQAEKQTGIPGGGPGVAASVGSPSAAGLGGPGGVLGGGGGHGAPGGGSGGGPGHGGAGGTSPFQAAAGSSSAAHPGAGAHVEPPPGSAPGGSSQFSAGGPGSPSGHGAASGPPAFGSGTAGSGGAAGHGGAGGAAGHSGLGNTGAAGGQGSQQPGVTGQSGSFSSSQSSQSHNASHGQAAGLNPPPGSPMSAGDVHSQMGAGTHQSNQLHSGSPPSADLHQGPTNANLGLNVHEGAHTSTTGSGFVQPPLEGGFTSSNFPTDSAAGSGSGFGGSGDIAYTPPPFDQFSGQQFSGFQDVPMQQSETVVNQVETQTVTQETQQVMQETQQVTQETQMVPQDIQTQVVQETSPAFVQDQPQQQAFEQQPPQYVEQQAQYIASGDMPMYQGGADQSRVVENTVTQENVSQQIESENKSIVSNAVTQGGLQSNVQAAGLSGGQAPQSAPGLIPPAAAAGMSALGKALGPAMSPGSQPQQRAEFSGPTHYGGYNEETEELAGGPPPLGEAGKLADAGAVHWKDGGQIKDSDASREDARIAKENIAKARQEDDEQGNA